ncbi:MAG: Subtilase family protein [Parcubacteria group bacterium ADurb.Bin016]|nr:MAG: Subtilase family protein [Parcubacteria group bacterium ADurb.Bin016]
MKNFEKIEHSQEQQMPISRFEDLRNKDLSDQNLSKIPIEVLQTVDFDTETIWPEKDKLPNGFNPKKLLEKSKNPGLGIKKLHEQGITGQGVVVAIIDLKLDINHSEYKDSISDYQEYDEAKNEPISMHGPAVTSLLVGKDCGVAPGAKLVYKAVPSGRCFYSRSKALNDIIENNKHIPQNEQVRIVSCSIGYMIDNPEPGLDKWIKTIQKAQEAGIFVIDVGGDKIDIDFTGGGSPENKDDFESYRPGLAYNDEKEDINKLILDKLIAEGNIDKILEWIKETSKDELLNISDSDLRKKIETHLAELKNKMATEIIVPSDYRTMASSWSKEGQYMYNGKGGMSWSVPYLAGLFALALQINPNLQKEEIAEIIKKSAVVNNKGLKIVNPEGIIELVKEKTKN